MAEFFKKILDTLKLSDEDEEAYTEFSKERDKAEARSEKRAAGAERSSVRASAAASKTSSAQTSVPTGRKAAHIQSNYGTSTYFEGNSSGKSLRIERPEGSNVVPLKTTSSGLEVCIMKPKSLDDARDVCDVLLSNCVAIVNLEDNDIPLSQRIMDFIFGAVYSINGKFLQISERIFITAPGAVDVSGDYNDILAQSGYDMPVLK